MSSRAQHRLLLCALAAVIALHPTSVPAARGASSSQVAEQKALGLSEVAHAHARKGEYPDAVRLYDEALRLKPEPTDVARSKARRVAQNELAWLLATCMDSTVRDGRRAVDLAEQLVSSVPGNAIFLDTLGAAYAAARRFDDAVKAERKALDLLPKGHSLRKDFQSHLKAYQGKSAWLEPSQPPDRPLPLSAFRVDFVPEGTERYPATNMQDVKRFKNVLHWAGKADSIPTDERPPRPYVKIGKLRLGENWYYSSNITELVNAHVPRVGGDAVLVYHAYQSANAMMKDPDGGEAKNVYYQSIVLEVIRYTD